MTCWVSYLGGHARKNCDHNLKRLKHNSADNYLSGLKSIIVARCDAEDNNHPIVFNDKNTAKYRTLLTGIFVDEAFSTGEQLSDPHIPASEEDRKATSMCCVWSNTQRSAEFMNLNNNKYTYTGRGTEIALVKHENIS